MRSFGNYYVAICRYVAGDTCPLSPKSAPSRTSTSCLAVYALPLRAKLKCLPWAGVGVEVQVQFELGKGGGCLKSLKSHRIASGCGCGCVFQQQVPNLRRESIYYVRNSISVIEI